MNAIINRPSAHFLSPGWGIRVKKPEQCHTLKGPPDGQPLFVELQGKNQADEQECDPAPKRHLGSLDPLLLGNKI